MEGLGDTAPTGDARWERRIRRERRARVEAEDLLEAKSRELYEANQALSQFASKLEQRVQDRTQELEQARERAVILAERDQLTGLANRMRFAQVFGDALVQAAAHGTRVALVLIDVDDFKSINDTLGHGAGDALLQSTAAFLSDVASRNVTMARLGGDEFAVVVNGFDTIADLTNLAEHILDAVRRPVPFGDHVLRASCSIGIAVCPEDGSNAADLQRYADVALYKSKSLGRARQTLFDAALKAEFEERYALAAELKTAIANNEIVPFFQPIVVAATGKMVGVEVLARWLHPDRGVIMPDLFIKLAEERGLTGSLFVQQLRTACQIAKVWVDQNVIDYVSINVSPSQFRSGMLADTIFEILDEVGLPPKALTIEITEELLLLDLDRARVQLEQLAGGDVRISLDDFGAGYSNIAYLRRLPIDTLKLDRLLTTDVCTDEKARSVLKAIVEIARALGLSLVAEGVETQAQARWLSQLGCEFLQGYLYGKPMSDDALLQEHRRATRGLLHVI